MTTSAEMKPAPDTNDPDRDYTLVISVRRVAWKDGSIWYQANSQGQQAYARTRAKAVAYVLELLGGYYRNGGLLH